MYFQTSFHVGSTTGYRGNGKLIIEMKPASLSYHGGQLCASLHPTHPTPVLECVLFYIYSHFLLINPYKCTQEKDVLRKGKVKNGAFIESKISQERPPTNGETGALVFHLISWLLDPSTQSQLIHQYF